MMGGGRGWASFITKVEESHKGSTSTTWFPPPPPPQPSPKLARHGSTLSGAGHLQSSSHGPEKDVSTTILPHRGSLETVHLRSFYSIICTACLCFLAYFRIYFCAYFRTYFRAYFRTCFPIMIVSLPIFPFPPLPTHFPCQKQSVAPVSQETPPLLRY